MTCPCGQAGLGGLDLEGCLGGGRVRGVWRFAGCGCGEGVKHVGGGACPWLGRDGVWGGGVSGWGRGGGGRCFGDGVGGVCGVLLAWLRVGWGRGVGPDSVQTPSPIPLPTPANGFDSPFRPPNSPHKAVSVSAPPHTQLPPPHLHPPARPNCVSGCQTQNPPPRHPPPTPETGGFLPSCIHQSNPLVNPTPAPTCIHVSTLRLSTPPTPSRLLGLFTLPPSPNSPHQAVK